MELIGEHIRVIDTTTNKISALIKIFEPVYQEAMTAIVGGAVAGAYVAIPTPAQCFALIAWENDNSLHIVSLDKLTLAR